MITYGFADKKDFKVITGLLEKNGLPVSDIHEGQVDFIIVKDDNQILGCIGLEQYGTEGLLRSFAVNNKYRNKGYGRELYNRLLLYAKQKGVRTLHLLTNTAKDYFAKTGFSIQTRDKAPDIIRRTREFASLCPSSSLYMTLEL